MKGKLYDMTGKAKEVELPVVFSTAYRPEIIQRAVLALQSSKRQAYGTDRLAGLRSSAHYHGSRHYRFTMMNKEMARISRIHGKAAGGTYLGFRARVVPQAVKGRRAHPPKPQKIWLQKINNKELLLALKSAIAATADKDLVALRGHRFAHEVPVVIDNEFENTDKTKKLIEFLNKIGFGGEIERCSVRKVRAGRGKMRGRRYKKKKGILFVFSKMCKGLKAAKNIAGADVVDIDELIKNKNVELFAPGCHAGRLTVYTHAAIDNLGKAKL